VTMLVCLVLVTPKLCHLTLQVCAFRSVWLEYLAMRLFMFRAMCESDYSIIVLDVLCLYFVRLCVYLCICVLHSFQGKVGMLVVRCCDVGSTWL
jgi:hypothetical protein